MSGLGLCVLVGYEPRAISGFRLIAWLMAPTPYVHRQMRSLSCGSSYAPFVAVIPDGKGSSLSKFHDIGNEEPARVIQDHLPSRESRP